jgi:alkylation response protein AidB-like acyl-CoA dehydrogenase
MFSKRIFAVSCRSVKRFSVVSAETHLKTYNLFNPAEEHASLRKMLRKFVEEEVDPQANEYNREEKFNAQLFRKLGDLGLLGITVGSEYGGSQMDATAAELPAKSSVQQILVFVFLMWLIVCYL